MSDIFVKTWTIRDTTTLDLFNYLRTLVAPNGGRVAFENGQVVLDERAFDLLRDLDDNNDGVIEHTPEATVMWITGTAYPVEPARPRGLHFHEQED